MIFDAFRHFAITIKTFHFSDRKKFIFIDEVETSENNDFLETIRTIQRTKISQFLSNANTNFIFCLR